MLCLQLYAKGKEGDGVILYNEKGIEIGRVINNCRHSVYLAFEFPSKVKILRNNAKTGLHKDRKEV